jgi:cation diffusion facilitator family transporter
MNLRSLTADPRIKLQIIIAILGVVLLIGKLWAYYLTNSNAILTDALESIVNVVAGFLGLYSIILSTTPSDENHPYGHGKAEFISASVEGFLVALAGASMVAKAVWGLLHPHALEDLELGSIIIAATAAVNWLAGYISRQYGTRYHSPALIAGGTHLQSDAYSTLGILLSLLLIYITGWQLLDNVVAIIFGVIIATTGYGIMRQSIAGIMDEADTELLTQLVNFLQTHRHSHWVDIHNLRVIKYGRVLHIDCHLTVPWYFSVQQAHDELEKVNLIVAQQIPNPIELFIHTDPCLPTSCPICTVSNCEKRQQAFKRTIEWTLENVAKNTKHRL